MQSLLQMACIAATGAIACGYANAAEKTVPINFIGDWCYISKVDKMTLYTLPGWTTDGHCTKTFSIDRSGFSGEGRHCEPVNIRLKRNFVAAGTAYIATVTARCQTDGQVTASGLQTFELNRYKGDLIVTE